MANETHQEGSRSTETYHFHCEKDTEHNKDKEAPSTVEYSDSLV